MKMIWCGLKIKENCHVSLINQFHGDCHSKTLGCRKIKCVFRDVKWCFNASWGLKGLTDDLFARVSHPRRPKSVHYVAIGLIILYFDVAGREHCHQTCLLRHECPSFKCGPFSHFSHSSSRMERCICHFTKWQIHLSCLKRLFIAASRRPWIDHYLCIWFYETEFSSMSGLPNEKSISPGDLN